MAKEAKARVKINKLLEEAGWRFEAHEDGPVNIQLEAGLEHRRADLENNYGK